jgi:hypothetical protein
MNGEIVVKVTKAKITEVNGSKHTIYLHKNFVTDSAFPFKPGQELTAKIVGKKVIFESAHGEAMKKGEEP